jgi:hypothetical protein
MAIVPLQNSALQGIQRGLSGIGRSAAGLARNIGRAQVGAAPTDYVRSLASMQQSSIQAKAATRALKTYHDTLGTLLDLRA